MNKILLEKELSRTKSLLLNEEELDNKEVITSLIRIYAFKYAQSKNFKWGSIKEASNKFSLLGDDISSYISNIRCYYGLNKKSFKTSNLTISLILMSDHFSLSELLLILEDIKKLDSKINAYTYLRKNIEKRNEEMIYNLYAIATVKHPKYNINSICDEDLKSTGQNIGIIKIKANYAKGVIYEQNRKRNNKKYFNLNKTIKRIKNFNFNTIIKIIAFINEKNIKVETIKDLEKLLKGES